jgi:hypothetical protein
MAHPIPEAAPTRQQAVKLGDERRQRIIDLISELLTGGQIETHELQHFAVIAHFLGLRKIVQDVAADGAIACGDRGARECLLALVLAAMQRLIADPEPVAPVKPKTVEAPKAKRVSRSTRKYRSMIAAMSPQELEAYRQKERERLKVYRKPAKAQLATLGSQ